MAGEWTAQLPDDLKTNEALTGYETIGDLAKDHLDVKGKLGEYEGKVKDFEGKVGDLEKRLANTIQKPSENATPEEVAAYHKALGVPSKPEDYKFEKPKDLPAGLEYQDSTLSWWAQLAHKVGLPDKTAKAIFEEYNKMAVANYNQQVKDLTDKVQKENEAAQTSLKEKWGPEYDKNFELAKRCVSYFGGDKFGEKVIQMGMGNDPDFLEFMVKVSKAFKDDTLADMTLGGNKKPDLKPGQLEWHYPSMGE
jgi:hypothetical protein